MTRRVVRSVTVRRPYHEVAGVVTDAQLVLEVVPGLARSSVVSQGGPDEGSEWDVFLEVGTLHIGGRVLVRRASADRLEWHSLRGTRHRFVMEVEPLGADSRVTMTVEYALSGLLMARVTETLGRGIVARHLEAGLEQLRHYLEYGEIVELP